MTEKSSPQPAPRPFTAVKAFADSVLAMLDERIKAIDQAAHPFNDYFGDQPETIVAAKAQAGELREVRTQVRILGDRALVELMKFKPAIPAPDPAPLPCPFCGNVGLHFGDGSTYRWGLASCSSCGATAGEVRRAYPDDGAWHADAIKEWNTRAAVQAPEGAQLPPLPEPHWPRGYQGAVPSGGYTADQMHAYARAALAAPAPQAPTQEPAAWLVLDRDGSLIHAAAWREAAHDHINDAISEHGISEAARWVVRPAFTAPQTKEPTNDR